MHSIRGLVPRILTILKPTGLRIAPNSLPVWDLLENWTLPDSAESFSDAVHALTENVVKYDQIEYDRDVRSKLLPTATVSESSG